MSAVIVLFVLLALFIVPVAISLRNQERKAQSAPEPANVAPKKPAAQSAPTTPRQHHYRFAHNVLRDLVLQDPVETWQAISGVGVGDVLTSAWLAAHDGDQASYVSPTGLRVSIHDDIGDGWRAAVITMPPAERPAEAHMAAILHKDIPTTNRYFVLERGFPNDDGSARQYWAEWRPDMRIRGGDVAEVSADAFLLEIAGELFPAKAA